MHFYQPAVFMCLYTIFTVVYWAAGGLHPHGHPYIYAILNWAEPARTVPLVVFGLLIGMPVIHVFIWMLHHFRDCCLLKVKLPTSVAPIKA